MSGSVAASPLQSRRNRKRQAAHFCFLAAALLWAASLAFPSLGARGGPQLTGYDVLAQGFGAWRYGVVAWFANPMLLIGIVAHVRGWRRSALAFSAAGLALALSSYWSGDIAALFGRPVPALSFAAGFYCWVAAHLAAVAGGVVGITARPGV